MNITKSKEAHKYRDKTTGYQQRVGRSMKLDRGMRLREANYHV